jgi:hypothetical protein
VLRQGSSATLVYRVADTLTDQVIADGEALKAVTLGDLQLALYITVVIDCLVHLEVVPPAGELQAIVAHLLGERREFL